MPMMDIDEEIAHLKRRAKEIRSLSAQVEDLFEWFEDQEDLMRSMIDSERLEKIGDDLYSLACEIEEEVSGLEELEKKSND